MDRFRVRLGGLQYSMLLSQAPLTRGFVLPLFKKEIFDEDYIARKIQLEKQNMEDIDEEGKRLLQIFSSNFEGKLQKMRRGDLMPDDLQLPDISPFIEHMKMMKNSMKFVADGNGPRGADERTRLEARRKLEYFDSLLGGLNLAL